MYLLLRPSRTGAESFSKSGRIHYATGVSGLAWPGLWSLPSRLYSATTSPSRFAVDQRPLFSIQCTAGRSRLRV